MLKTKYRQSKWKQNPPGIFHLENRLILKKKLNKLKITLDGEN